MINDSIQSNTDPATLSSLSREPSVALDTTTSTSEGLCPTSDILPCDHEHFPPQPGPKEALMMLEGNSSHTTNAYATDPANSCGIFSSMYQSPNTSQSLPSETSESEDKRIQCSDSLPNDDQSPLGSLNNYAGESLPSAKSTFRVGVTEDTNKSCRRTMEDTHSFIYNFLGSSSISPSLPNMGQDTTNQASPSIPVETDNGYFAVFDGHAGAFAANWCGRKLHLVLEDAIRQYPTTPIPELLDYTFTSVDHKLKTLPLNNSGCTAAIAVVRWEYRKPFISQTSTSLSSSETSNVASSNASKPSIEGDGQTKTLDESLDQSTNVNEIPCSDAPTHNLQIPGKSADGLNPCVSNDSSCIVDRTQSDSKKLVRQRVLYTANVGDARVVLCRNGRAYRLSYDHKGSDKQEGQRVVDAGGLILNNRVNGVLAVTRALGDAYMKELVTGHPYTTETILSPECDEFLILACDGLWDVCSDQAAVDLVRDVHDPQEASRILVQHALRHFSTDNLSCMIVRFDNKAVMDQMGLSQADNTCNPNV